MKKKYILVLTFLFMLCGQISFGQAINGGELDDVTIDAWKNIDLCAEFGIDFPKDPDEYEDTGDCQDSRSYAYPCEYEDDGNCADNRSSAYPCDDWMPCALTCEGNFELDPDNCKCVCNLSCPNGYKLDSAKCECVKDPCDTKLQTDVKKQFTDPLLVNRLTQVRTNLQPPNTSLESGFAIYKDSNGNNLPGALIPGTLTIPSVSISFIITPGYTPSAMVHGHPSGVYANPSAGDIYGLAGVYSSGNTITTSYVPAADGTTYAMVITDPTALANFQATYPASINQLNDSFKLDSPMYDLYKDAYDSFKLSGLSTDTAEERANAVIMAEAGITLVVY